MEPRRPHVLDAGLFLVVVAVPLAFTPFTASPFADPKLVLLTLGTLLVWIGGPPVDRRLAWAAGAWFAATALAAAFGVDPLRSLTGYELPLTGLGMFACCAVLVVTGAGLDRERIERACGWLVWTGLGVAAVTIAWKLAPDAVGTAIPDLSLRGGTIGNPVFASAVMAAALAGALLRPTSGPRHLATIVVLTSGISLGGERVAWLLPAIAVVATLWWARVALRRAVALGAIVVAVPAAWALIEPVLPDGTTTSPVAQLSSLASDTGRLTAFAVDTRAWIDRPLLGWGPANTWSAYRATASPEEISSAGVGWDEAHNLVIQTAASSGLVGLIALGALLTIVIYRALRAPKELAWAVGALVTLGAFAMFEPFNVAVTPLTFLLAGMTAATATRPATELGPRRVPRRVGAVATGVGISLALVLAGITFAASTLERWGARYEEQWALRAAIRLQPWRASAKFVLLEDLALDARSRQVPGARESAHRLIDDLVGNRGWDPRVRPEAVNESVLMNEPEAARTLLLAQIDLFPGDRAALPDPDELSQTSIVLPGG